VERKHGWRWLGLVGRAVVRATAPVGGTFFCLPPASVIRQWPADAAMWTPEDRLGEWDRQAWSEIEAGLRRERS
jgi:hypothetical protein